MFASPLGGRWQHYSHQRRIETAPGFYPRLVMQLLLRDRRRDEALRQYRECRDALQRELGLAPAVETEALHRSIVTAATTAEPRADPGRW
ncbi:MAG: bacterial transcriptional activator domain-containing protein [Chloroflexi bacterium]|nr:bacterial transcriptional activator domain-containing protein [Chloroflexota bacterium]